MQILSCLIAAATLVATAQAQELSQPSIFGDHMVLQADASVPFWGQAVAAAEVELLGGWWTEPMRTQADADGAWSLVVDSPSTGGPYTIEVRSGGQSLRYEDVILGEVWVCGGQSNMEWTLGPGVGPGIANWQEEVADANYPQIRFFDVPHKIAASPQTDAGGEWKLATPENAPRFSAVGYLYGRRLHKELGVPVGLIGCNWGGTLAEAWTSRETLEAFGEFEAGLKQMDAIAGGDSDDTSFQSRKAAWWDGLAKVDRGSGTGAWWAKQPSDAGPWQTVTLPGTWENSQPGSFDGIVWYRRTIEISEGWVGKDLRIRLGAIDDYDTTWVNGVLVGQMHEQGNWTTPRNYVIPASAVPDQSVTIAVRVLDTGGGGGFASPPDSMTLEPVQGRNQARRLDGEWQMRVGAPIAKVGQPPSKPAMGPNMPTALHNGMLRTIIPFGMRGAIWYQGESNRGRAYQYRRLFPAMIADWRALWGRGDFPFYFVQIAPYNYGGDSGQAAALREAQTLAMRVPNTGMAVTMDIGNPGNIHPTNKQDVAERLARWALAKTYGMDSLVFSGPLLAGYRAETGQIRLFFDHAEGGLKTRDGEALSHFTIAGEDQVFHAATASIEKHEGRWTIVVKADAVKQPRAVRYAWGTSDEPNLANEAGLPAPSFRTDSWPAWPGGPIR